MVSSWGLSISLIAESDATKMPNDVVMIEHVNMRVGDGVVAAMTSSVHIDFVSTLANPYDMAHQTTYQMTSSDDTP